MKDTHHNRAKKLTRDDFLRRLQVLKEEYRNAQQHASWHTQNATNNREYWRGRTNAYMHAIQDLNALIRLIQQTEA